MKKNKLMYLGGMVFVMFGFVLFTFVSADNKGGSMMNGGLNGNENGRGGMMQSQEAKQRGTTLEVHISNSGKVDVRGAKVTSVSGNTVNVSTTWGSLNLSWAVNVLPNANMTRKGLGATDLSKILVGDLVNFQGNLVTTSASPIMVDASMIRDWTMETRNVSLNGTVKSVDTANSKFVMSSNIGDVTVSVSSSTTFEKGDAVDTFTDVTVGARVLAKGAYDSQLKQLRANDVKVQVPKVLGTNGNNGNNENSNKNNQ